MSYIETIDCTFVGVFPSWYGLGDSVYFLIVYWRRNAGLDYRMLTFVLKALCRMFFQFMC